MQDPAITVIVPCHNYSEYVARCLDTLLRQRSNAAFEIIVIDDASSDGSWSIIEAHCADPRVRAIRHEENLSAVPTYNEGLAQARGDFVVILSADDLAWSEDAVHVQRAMLLANPSAAFAFSQVKVIDVNDRVIGTMTSPLGPGLIAGRRIFERLAGGNFVPHSGTMVRRSHLDVVGFLDPELLYTHDWDQWLRLSARFDAVYTRRSLYAYRIHSRQLHTRDYGRSMIEWRMVLDRARAALPAVISERKYLRSVASGYVRRAHAYCAQGQFRHGLRDLRDAAAIDPRALFDDEFAKSLAYLLASPLGVLGRRLHRP